MHQTPQLKLDSYQCENLCTQQYDNANQNIKYYECKVHKNIFQVTITVEPQITSNSVCEQHFEQFSSRFTNSAPSHAVFHCLRSGVRIPQL